MNRLTKPLVISFVVLSFLVIRLIMIPGVSFNQEVWDDEVFWIKDSNSKSIAEYILYRDAPGYFVFVPRILILLGNFVPSFDSISSLRVIVYAVQLICLAAATACVTDFRHNSKLFVFLYFSLLMTYVEDLNYVHNVGYIFIFPIFFLVFKRVIEGRKVPLWRIGVAALLISKPFTALIVSALVALFIWKKASRVMNLLLLAAYCFVYLAAYIFLPSRWETPFNSDPITVFKVVFDLPWVIFSSLHPIIAIGGLGFAQLLDIRTLGIVLGVFVYGLFGLVLFWQRAAFIFWLKHFGLLTWSLILIFLVNYILVFSASDSLWIKYFPLFQLDPPQFIWARWSAVIPLSFLLIVASINFLAPKVKLFFFSYMTLQWLILITVANPWLRRYW